MNWLPRLKRGQHTPATAIAFAPLVQAAAELDVAGLLTRLATSATGLTSSEAATRLLEYGPNRVAVSVQHGWPWRLLEALRGPLVILLLVLASISFASGDHHAPAVMLVMVVISVFLQLFQTVRADAAAAHLTALISVTARVTRDGKPQEIPLSDLVPGDLISLSAGDMLPADVRLLTSKDLFVNQAALTGESIPVEKQATADAATGKLPLELRQLAFLGTSVESGAASAMILATGANTYFGRMATTMTEEQEPTQFDQGVKQFTWLMIRFIFVMVPLVLVITGLTQHDWHAAVLFALAVAVGMTPEMLPMIVSVCLANGALAMAQQKVIVKRLGAIQNFGAMDVLCTDKTGTLTQDQVILQKHCDLMRRESEDVFRDAYLIAEFQTGLQNALDRAVLNHPQGNPDIIKGYAKVDEIPFDFVRQLMSVVVVTPEQNHRLLSKGAPEAIFSRCTAYELDGQVLPLKPTDAAELNRHHQALNADGFRVLAVAYKPLPLGELISKDDESELILKGYIAFLDPPKESASSAIAALQHNGIQVKVLTGDNDIVTRKVCSLVGLPVEKLLMGHEIEAMNDAELGKVVTGTQVFARVSPEHKRRVIRALQQQGHVVGFLGDGINDAPALHVADVGISVDSAVDIAKAAASVILLEKNLMVLNAGVIAGRKVFVNILRYIRMGASSSFGNMFSVLGASAFLPFVPMMPIQVLTNNLLYDFSQLPTPTDNVSAELTTQPRPWDITGIKKFVLFIGPISSIFDYTTFAILLYGFGAWDPARAAIFQTGWFVESILSQVLIVHIIRTNKIPFLQDRASWQLSLMSCCVAIIAIGLPYSPLASALGFTPLPITFWPILLVTLCAYGVLTQRVKTWLVSKAWL